MGRCSNLLARAASRPPRTIPDFFILARKNIRTWLGMRTGARSAHPVTVVAIVRRRQGSRFTKTVLDVIWSNLPLLLRETILFARSAIQRKGSTYQNRR